MTNRQHVGTELLRQARHARRGARRNRVVTFARRYLAGENLPTSEYLAMAQSFTGCGGQLRR